MNHDLINILLESKEIDQQKLLDYLQDKLSPEEAHEIEKKLIDGDFESDAAEGLQQVRDKTKLPLLMSELNRQIIQKLSKRRKGGRKRKPLNLMIPVVVSIIILLLIWMFFLYIRHRL